MHNSGCMKPEPPQIAALSAMITRDLEAIHRLEAELTPAAAALQVPRPQFRDVAAAAYVLHNIYTALENIFEQISRTFENHIVDQARHRELLTKMFLEIPKIRPVHSSRTETASKVCHITGDGTICFLPARDARLASGIVFSRLVTRVWPQELSFPGT